ncbi:hypothetical protein QVD17_19802 [Tagetes erecta]|uniref:Transposase n=1 Tax=Tagetes erecta TaxID=13708 RepID=A0AAD8NXA1_TARER|nr:hypothetical protein QVD17_19802 [Tagetes erecta]
MVSMKTIRYGLSMEKKIPKLDFECPNESRPPDFYCTKEMLHDAFTYAEKEPDSLKSLFEEYVQANFVVDPKSRKQTLQSIRNKWRNFKHTLYKRYIEKQKNDLVERKILLTSNPPKKYPYLKKEDWKLFVAQRLSKNWEMQQTSKAEEEIDRALLWKKARVLKTGGFDKDVQFIVDKIDKLQKSEGCGEVTCGTDDVLTQALGTKEQHGHHFLDTEKKKYDQRFNKLEDELEKLKRGMINASEAESCQMCGDNEDFEDDPIEESFKSSDNSCYLRVGVASDIVAKGSIMSDICEEEFIEVTIEICLQGEALLPIPFEDEFIVKVKDAVGHILSWPKDLVVRCSDLEKVMAKPMRKSAKELACKNGKKRLRKKKRRMEKCLKSRKKRRRKKRLSSIKVQCENDLFGYESFTYLTWNDFEAIYTCDELSGVINTSYMMFLYEQIKNGQKQDHGICFVSPTATSPSERKSKSRHVNDSIDIGCWS